ncbi:MAG: hypothetical protein RIS70_1179 [Planctomycetota bacterium]
MTTTPLPNTAATAEPLSLAQLRWRCNPQQFTFTTTNDLPELDVLLGQPRALSALRFGIAIRREGYNLYVQGPPGIGKQTAVLKCLEQTATQEPTPSDWCYVNNFADVRRPKAIALPAGQGKKFCSDLKELTSELATAIPAALERDEHKSRVQQIVREEAERQAATLEALSQKAQEKSVQLIRTPGGFALAPLQKGEVLSPDEYQQLSDEEKKKIQQTITELQTELQSIVEQVPKRNKGMRDSIKKLNRDAVQLAIGHLLSQIKQKYLDIAPVREFLEAFEKDILERGDEFEPVEESPLPLLGLGRPQPLSFEDYEANLLVDNSESQGAPIIYEDHPSYHNLIGRVEHESQMGALLTDFSLIKGGALHRANGGYLILDTLRLLQQPYAWEGLKRALYSDTIKIESLGESLSLISTVSLEPEPIPLDVKVILLGDRMLYYLLYDYDPDFAELFKVAADFEDCIDRSEENCELYARFVATLAQREKLRPVTRDAVALVIEHGARLAEDSERLSLHTRTLADLLREADYWASEEDSDAIEVGHIKHAIEQQRYRLDRIRERIHEEIRRGTILIDLQGSQVGQVNGLSVLDLGNHRFGQPSRITATARLGRGEVVDIEREAKLGGAIHSKGVLILGAFLASRFAADSPLSLNASLVFEQSYGMVDGDSASVAELCALLSVLSGVPLRQNLAVTGSVNQLGQVQAIGGVNEKIEGFFACCKARGLTGDQGVVIPAANVKHLMVDQEILDAVSAGHFRIYAVETIDDALSLLTGVPAGTRDETGKFPAETVNGRVERRLSEFARLRQEFGTTNQSPPKGDGNS